LTCGDRHDAVIALAAALNEMLGLDEDHDEQPLAADEVPEPELGAWEQDADFEAAVA